MSENYEEDDAYSSWRQPDDKNLRDLLELHNIENKGPSGQPDEVWMVAPRFNISLVYKHMDNISDSTDTYMIYDEEERKISIWGQPKGLKEAFKQWTSLDANMLEYREKQKKNDENFKKANKNPVKERGWAKPDKELTKKEERKLKRREERERLGKVYLSKPPDLDPSVFSNHGYFAFPDYGINGISIKKLIGDNDDVLNPVRIGTKCHIWHEKTNKGYKIVAVGDTVESVEEAISRVRNLYFKLCKLEIASHNRVYDIEPPRNPYKIRIADPPPWFILPYDILNKSDDKYKVMEPVYDGEIIQAVGKKDFSKESRAFNPDITEVTTKHRKKINESICKALETIHLFDQEIKMRIRFGHLCLISSRDFSELKPVSSFNENILSKSRFAKCLATEYDQLSGLFETLSEGNQIIDGSPFREFKIYASRKTQQDETRQDEKGSENLRCVFEVEFSKDIVDENNGKNIEKQYSGKIGLWNALIHERNILDTNVVCLENNYSWKLNIRTAKRLPNNKSCPQGNFIDKLRICPKGRLVYSNTYDIKVNSVCEKTKWKFYWSNDYIVEVTRYEYWYLSRNMNRKYVEIPLSDEDPPKITFGITLYKKSWEDLFKFNGNLNVGEAPEWHPHDVMDEEVNLLDNIQNFLKLLDSKLPVQKEN